ncbi:hypothetical protein LSUE1_G010274, partial [Lachnellula suecica]
MPTVTGKCLCGEIAYKYTGNNNHPLSSTSHQSSTNNTPAEPVLNCICHCTDCKKWTGSLYTWNVVVPQPSFKVTKGEPESYSVIGASGKKHPHFFCG